MNTKKIIFLAHDPGGYDVIFPLVKCFEKTNIPFEFYCIGPSAKINLSYGISPEKALEKIQCKAEKEEITLLVAGTSWGTDAELTAIQICNQKNIPTMSILDYWVHYKLRFQGEKKQVVYPKYYILMDELAKQEAIQEGVPSDILYVLGHPGLDFYVHNFINKKKNIGETKKKVLFLSQPLSQLYGETLGYTEQSVLQDCIQIVQMELEWILHVKFHPKEDPSFKKKYKIFSVERTVVELLSQYDCVIGMNTMALLHGVLMGVPVISYQPNLKQEDKCITNKLGLTKRIASYEALKQCLQNQEFISGFNMEELTSCFIWLDGQSTKRISDFIMEVLNNEY